MLRFMRIGFLLVLVLIATSGSMQVAAARASALVTVWLQVMDSCKQGVPGASFTLVTPHGSTINAGPSSGTSRATIASKGSCPLQRGNCQQVPVGCLSWTITPPRSGTALYTIRENSRFDASDGFYENPPGKTPFTGFVPCNGGSACQSEIATFTINSSGVVSGVTTNIFPDGAGATYPSNGKAPGTKSDPIVFHNFMLGNGSCDGDHDADDHLTGTPSAHCDSDHDK